MPGTRWRIGYDAIIGLIPGAGDVASALLSVYIFWRARQLGASRWAQFRMAGNIILDTAVGAVPFVGDIFDARWKTNLRNIRILRKDLAGKAAAGRKQSGPAGG